MVGLEPFDGIDSGNPPVLVGLLLHGLLEATPLPFKSGPIF